MQKDLLGLEKQESSVNFKMGVIYAKGGQILDDEILSNTGGSPEFDDFLSLLGEKIQLKGWEQYRLVQYRHHRMITRDTTISAI